MHTLSSASRTCMASASAVECTATVGMPSSLQARKTRNAISPRLAMRIFSNMWSDQTRRVDKGVRRRAKIAMPEPAFANLRLSFADSFDNQQRLAEFDRLAVLEQNLHDCARARGRDL